VKNSEVKVILYSVFCILSSVFCLLPLLLVEGKVCFGVPRCAKALRGGEWRKHSHCYINLFDGGLLCVEN
jgi:hypothetical protein